MNMKLFSILILNINVIFSATYIIKNDSNVKLFVVDPNSGYALSIEPNKIGSIDTTLRGFKKLFVNETLNFFEQDMTIGFDTFKLKYQLRDNDFARKATEISYSQIKHFADQSNQELVITKFQ